MSKSVINFTSLINSDRILAINKAPPGCNNEFSLLTESTGSFND